MDLNSLAVNYVNCGGDDRLFHSLMCTYIQYVCRGVYVPTINNSVLKHAEIFCFSWRRHDCSIFSIVAVVFYGGGEQKLRKQSRLSWKFMHRKNWLDCTLGTITIHLMRRRTVLGWNSTTKYGWWRGEKHWVRASGDKGGTLLIKRSSRRSRGHRGAKGQHLFSLPPIINQTAKPEDVG